MLLLSIPYRSYSNQSGVITLITGNLFQSLIGLILTMGGKKAFIDIHPFNPL